MTERTSQQVQIMIAFVIACGLWWLVLGFSQVLNQHKMAIGLVEKAVINPSSHPAEHARDAKQREIKARFEHAVVMLHAKQYDYAIKSLHRVIQLAPTMPEAHVNLGFAFLGGGDPKTAADFFRSAIELKPQQLNAYYGLAVAAEKQGDIETALGAMRTYIHLSPKDDPFLAKARSAVWEWQESRTEKTKFYTDPTPVVTTDK